MAQHLISLEYPYTRPGSIATIGEVMFHCTHLQNQKQVVVALNPNFTAFDSELIEYIASGAFLIFDIYKNERLSIHIRGIDHVVEFLTWAKTSDGKGLRFDFQVEVKEP